LAKRAASSNEYIGHNAAQGHLRRLHVQIADAALGVCVPLGAEVHHINKDKHDNRPQNLLICLTVRLHDLVEAFPKLLRKAQWLGVPGQSVRILRSVEPDGLRMCVRCGKLKDPEAFYRGPRGRLRGHCKVCHVI
jgi:hypothetical protein